MAAPDVPDWTRVVLLSGIDPSGNPITIGVDENGYIVAIMKGEYSGTLKNVAVDSAGRLIMIPTDPADVWGNAISMGNAELAAALSPAKRFDRRGAVLFCDTFEDGISKWKETLSGAGASIELSSTYSFHGGLAVKMIAGSTLFQTAALSHGQYYPSATKLGFECAFTLESAVERIEWDVIVYTGSRVIDTSIRYDVNDHKIQYDDSAGNYQDLQTGIYLALTAGYFHAVKVVIDPIAEKYVRLLLDKESYDMSALSCEAIDDTTASIIEVIVRVKSDTGVNATVYVDSAILTQNEPPN